MTDADLEHFSSLVGGMGALIGLTLEDLDSGGASLRVNDVDIELLLDTRPATPGVLFEFRLGTAPAHRELEFHRAIAAAHRLWSRGEGWSISVHPETLNVSLCQRRDLAVLTPQKLADEIAALMEIADIWRDVLARAANEAPEFALEPSDALIFR